MTVNCFIGFINGLSCHSRRFVNQAPYHNISLSGGLSVHRLLQILALTSGIYDQVSVVFSRYTSPKQNTIS